MGGGRRNSRLKLWGGHTAPSLTVDQQTTVMDKNTSGEGRPWEGGAMTREAGQSQAGRLEEGGANRALRALPVGQNFCSLFCGSVQSAVRQGLWRALFQPVTGVQMLVD